MPTEPARSRGFRLIVPLHAPPELREGLNPVLREAVETTEILSYARRLWSTPHDRVRFLLELPASRRWLETTLSAKSTGGEPVTLVTGEIVQLPHRLTARELVVLTLLAAGHSNPAIAEYLYTSPRTVSTQVETIRAKLGAISRTAASVLAVQNGWVRLPVPAPPEALGGLDIAGLVGGPAGEPAVSERALDHRFSPIRLGLAYPGRGPAGHDGEQSRRGAQLAIEQINLAGGVRGRRIEAVEVDADIYSAEGVRSTFAELSHADVQGVLMSYVFDEPTAFEEAARLGVPVLHTMTSKRHLETVRSDPARFRNVFQCAPPETNYGGGLARFLDLLDEALEGPGASRSILFVETTADSGQIADARTLAMLEARGWSVLGIEPLAAEDAEIHRLAARILADPPTVLVVTEFLPAVLAAMLVELRRAGCPSIIYTIYAPSVPEFVERAGAAAEGLVWATVSGTYPDPIGEQFSRAFEQRYGSVPGLSQAGLGYDMVHLIAGAWRHATDASDIAGALEALRATRYRGVNGSYTFSAGLQSTVAYPDETPDPSVGIAHLIFQVQDGRHRCIDPVPYREAFLRPPLAK